jgi:hypothetical protein
MPRTARFDDLDLTHQEALRMVTAWMRKKEKASAASPLALAQKHIGQHGGLAHGKCRLCGAACAILHCYQALKEEMGYRLLQTLRASREKLSLLQSGLFEAAASYVDAKRNRKHKTMDDSPPEGPVAKKIAREDMPLLFDEIKTVLREFKQLARIMVGAEMQLAGRFTTPALVAKLRRRPRDYLRTAIDCYLFRHGWTASEIFSLYHPDSEVTLSGCGHIYDRVERARKTGHPPLIGGWPPRKERASSKTAHRASA